jgi:hypothetical protein
MRTKERRDSQIGCPFFIDSSVDQELVILRAAKNPRISTEAPTTLCQSNVTGVFILASSNGSIVFPQSSLRIPPRRIASDDEGDLLCARPSLDLFLSPNGVMDVLKLLKVDQPVDSVSCRKRLWIALLLMLLYPHHQPVRDAGIEMMEGVGENIYEVAVVAHVPLPEGICAPNRIVASAS